MPATLSTPRLLSRHRPAAGVALLLAGWHRTSIPQAGHHLRVHVADALGADILMALTYRRTESCASISACGLRQRLSHLQPVTQLVLERMPTVGELLQHLEALPHWHAVLRAFNSTRHWRGYHRLTRGNRIYLDTSRPRNVTCTRREWRDGDERRDHPLGGRVSPYTCDGLREWGNTIFAPVIGPSNYNVLWQVCA